MNFLLSLAMASALLCPEIIKGVSNLKHLPFAWFYPDGSVVTLEAGRVGAKWYYPNGQLVAYNIGSPETIWFRPDGGFFIFGPKLDANFLEDVPSVLAHISEWLESPTPETTYGHLWIKWQLHSRGRK